MFGKLKEKLKSYLADLGYTVTDKGAFVLDNDDDYPDFIRPVAEAVAKEAGSFGIILGGSGNGEAMCANRVKGARAMVFYGPKEAVRAVDVTGRKSSDLFELIKLGRDHNHANILSLGIRFLTEDEAKTAIKIFLNTPYSKEERHIRRVKKLDIDGK